MVGGVARLTAAQRRVQRRKEGGRHAHARTRTWLPRDEASLRSMAPSRPAAWVKPDQGEPRAAAGECAHCPCRIVAHLLVQPALPPAPPAWHTTAHAGRAPFFRGEHTPDEQQGPQAMATPATPRRAQRDRLESRRVSLTRCPTRLGARQVSASRSRHKLPRVQTRAVWTRTGFGGAGRDARPLAGGIRGRRLSRANTNDAVASSLPPLPQRRHRRRSGSCPPDRWGMSCCSPSADPRTRLPRGILDAVAAAW